MAKFDLKSFLGTCVASVEEFKKQEMEQFPECVLLMPQSPIDINRRFRSELDAIKEEHGFVPTEIYISSDSPSEVTAVAYGEELLDLQVVFHPWFNVRRLAEKPNPWKNNGVVQFSFEEEVAREYRLCRYRFEQFSHQLKTAWNARDVPHAEREAAIRFIHETSDRAREMLSAYRGAKVPNSAKRQVKARLAHLSLLESRLKMLDPRRVQRP